MGDLSSALFIDTSAFKAIIDAGDDFHKRALEIWSEQQKRGILCVTSNYILDETFTLLRKRNGFKTVDQFRGILSQSSESLFISRVSVEDEAEAWKWFSKDWSGLSFTDCVSFAQMNRLEVSSVFSFDKHFSRAGFTRLS